ncbi:adenosine deaminase family protein [Duganella violaceipulchra]|uniref:adenosine deaminase n=1 Tax=Duganella violaceipulchra TaxID=2849652 RepID=A0AA41H9A7_9BURK|nr:adenosine deaminase [Duganella violaceicalia]MBV6322246.1 adenosine deaminase [Duganella violaceicalia]MCP2011393.1 adenosine deaminase/adenosine deaminase CECR1 [Duganella violaceicalia]
MQNKIASLKAAALAAALFCALPHGAQAASNEEITKRQFAALVSGPEPKTAELTMFLTMMPKGGDLHHHYSGAIYAEQYLEWVDKEGYCVNKVTYQIDTNKADTTTEQAKPLADRVCLSGQDVMNNNTVLANLLQRWSDKDFYNHGALQSPPDRQFFDTFGYFNAVASTNAADGLLRLKQRAIQENLGYIETIYEIAPMAQDAAFDQKAAAGAITDADLAAYAATLDTNGAFQGWISAYLKNIDTAGAGIDDANFTLRYQPFALRFLTPSQVFSQMVSSFKLALSNPKIVGVNIVGQESVYVSMHDYALHMQMYKFLKSKHPGVKLALHAGELALGVVPPEGLTFHIKDAIDVAGASRIGHGIDIAHETDSLAIMKKMHDKQIAVEVNLTSNQFILGVKGEAHPVTLYRKYGVPFVLSTDDAGVSRNNLSGEYVLYAARYKPGYAEIKKLSYDSIRYSFLADADKQRLLKALDGKFAKFEAAIAASQAGAAR